MDIKFLRHNLKPRHNKKFIKWSYENKQHPGDHELHHITGSPLGGPKYNDYLLAEIKKLFHTEITYNRKPTEQETEMMMILALENIFDYIEHLEKVIETMEGEIKKNV